MTLSTPQAVQERLEAIENDLAERQNDFEEAAFDYFTQKRNREKERAKTFMRSPPAYTTIAERSAHADKETADIGAEAEATYEAMKAVIRVLETRAAVGMSILRSQGRAG